MRARKLPVSDPEGAHRAASFGQLALVAIESGQTLRWDPEREQVLDNPELARHPRLGARVTA